MSESNEMKQKNVLFKVQSYSEQGNLIFILGDTYYNSKLISFKEQENLYFQIKGSVYSDDTDYTLKVMLRNELDLQLGKIYTTKIDKMVNNLEVNMNYNGQEHPNLTKLRFQLTAVMFKNNYTLKSMLKSSTGTYQMNQIFKHLVGGILSEPNLTICKQENCKYTMSISLVGIKIFNIESFLIDKMEELSIQHYNEYYDKVYDQNSITYYKLKYIPEIKDHDISINLIPVTGNNGLFVNAKNKPLDISKYYWQEEGMLAKRITIKAEELKQMKAEGSDFYIAVKNESKGEYLIKIDAHNQGFIGRLSSGVQEAGFVLANEIQNYLYSFESSQTQDISFIIKLSIISGSSNLYLKKCKDIDKCSFDNASLENEKILKVVNNHSLKEIHHNFKCEKQFTHQPTYCRFVIGVQGTENHGTHYDISLQEDQQHVLVIPGHNMEVTLLSTQKKYLKFSFPSKKSNSSRLYIAIEPFWGNFILYMDKNEEYPSETVYKFKKEFNQEQNILYNSEINIHLEPNLVGDYQVEGIYYIGIEATTSTSLNIRFFEQSENDLSIHTLAAGSQQHGQLKSSKEIIYYSIKVSLEENKANTVSVDLFALRGQYVIFASRSGILPTKQNNELITHNNHLDLIYDEYAIEHQYIIGVQLAKDFEGESLDYQFKISLSHADKPIKLTPMILGNYIAKSNNYFIIEILKEMYNVLILKGIVDGYNLKLCSQFSSSDEKFEDNLCKDTADGKQSFIFYEEKDLKDNCDQFFKENKRCFIELSLSGFVDQKFSIGFTYNNLPFNITSQTIIKGPSILQKDYQINFIFHPEPDQNFGIYFNSKGSKMKLYSKIVQADDYQHKSIVTFPNAANYDQNNQTTVGHITTLAYSSNLVNKQGKYPEVLVSINPDPSRTYENFKAPFDKSNSFILQSFMDSKEITRTEIYSQFIYEDEISYFHFYNNGNSDVLSIYVNTNNASLLDVMISKNLDSRPPVTEKPIIQKSGIDSVVLDITPDNLKLSSTNKMDLKVLKGYYTVAVKSKKSSLVHLYWNNKEDLDYFEITPNLPQVINLSEKKKLYFSFYVDSKQIHDELQEKDKKDENPNVSIHLKSDTKTNLYLLASSTNELISPSEQNYTWKTSLGSQGGISILTIKTKDQNYCKKCTYLGYIESDNVGQLSILAHVGKNYITLSPSFTFPDYLESHQGRKYRIVNIENDQIYFNISLLSGTVNIFIDTNENVSMTQNKDSYYLQHTMETHKFISLDPSNYQYAQEIYIWIENPKLDPCYFNIQIYNKKAHSNIESGITKHVLLSGNDFQKFYFKQKENQRQFDIRMTLKKIENIQDYEEVIKMLPDFIDVKLFNDKQEFIKLKSSIKSINDNKVYLNFETLSDQLGQFEIKLTNLHSKSVTVNLDLIVGNYKLINLNEPIIDFSSSGVSQIYEIYGIKERFLLMDLKVCFGKPDVSFYESDYDQLQKNEFSNYKTIQSSQSFTHYLRIKSGRVFAKIENTKQEKSVYRLMFYNESDMDNNPYSDLTQGNQGQVLIENDSNLIKFQPLKMNNVSLQNFKHKVVYNLYLTNDFKLMRFLKYCGDHNIDKVFTKAKFKHFKKVYYFENSEKMNQQTSMVQIPYDTLSTNTKYYGIVNVEVNLLPKEDGFVDPVKRGLAYYDEFEFVSSKIKIPLTSIISYSVVLAFIFVIYLIVKEYVFGNIKEYNQLNDEKIFKKFKGNVLGSNSRNILESEFYVEKASDKKDEQQIDIDEMIQADKEIELSNMDDKNLPLDLDSQFVNIQSIKLFQVLLIQKI